MERRNRQNAEIEITNEENESIYNSLKEKNELFKKEVRRLENEYAEIKNKQNNLNILKQSEMKKIIDREDIINNLNKNKNKLEEHLNVIYFYFYLNY